MKFRQLDKHANYIFVQESRLARGLLATMHDRSDVSQTCAEMARDVTPEEAARYQALFAKAPEMYELILDFQAALSYSEVIHAIHEQSGRRDFQDRITTLLAEIEG